MATTIISNPMDYTGKELYRVTKSQSIKKVSIIENAVTVNGYVIFTDTDKDGNEIEILSIDTNDGAFATNSKTFIESFLDIVEMLDTPVEIIVGHGTSKNGRNYIYCDIA